jgi:hypothetical protein
MNGQSDATLNWDQSKDLIGSELEGIQGIISRGAHFQTPSSPFAFFFKPIDAIFNV